MGIRRVSWICVLAVTAALLLTGCQPGSPVGKTNPIQSEDVTLTVLGSWHGSDLKAETLQTLMAAFEQMHPHVEIHHETLSSDDYLEKLILDFASGNAPDVFGLWPGPDLRKLVHVGKVADLTGVLDMEPAWKESFDRHALQLATINERVYGLPFEIVFQGLYVNADLFEAYDVKIPQTYEDLKKAVVVFREHGIIPIAFNCKTEGTYLYQNMAMMMGGREAVEHPIMNGAVDPCYIQAMYNLKELYDLGAFPDNVFTLTDPERNNLFIRKQAAMTVQSSWFTSSIPDSSSVKIVPFPEMVETNGNYSSMVYGLGDTLYISQSAWNDPKKRDAAITLLKYMTSSETASVYAEKTGILTGVSIDPAKTSYPSLAADGIELVTSAKELLGSPDSYFRGNLWENAIVKDLPYMLEGELTPETLWYRALEAQN